MMKRPQDFFRRLRKEGLGTRGSAALELALVAPFLVLLMSGGWDLGNALLMSDRMASAAKAGAQYGVTSPANATDFAGMVKAARNDANDASNSLTVTATQACLCPGSGAVACNSVCATSAPPNVYVAVSVSGNYATLFSYPYIPNPMTLSRQAMIRVQ